jgi:hypothetical protein
MANKEKYCPWFKQVCIKDKCEVYSETLKNCQVSVISYNLFKLTAALKDKDEIGKSQGHVDFTKSQVPGIPFSGIPS